MKEYTGLVVHLLHSMKQLLLDWCDEEGYTFYFEPDEERLPGMFAARQVGVSHTNPVDDIRQFVEDNNLQALVVSEETIFHTNSGESGSAYDIFTEYTFTEGVLSNVDAEVVEVG